MCTTNIYENNWSMLSENVMPRTKMTCTKFKNSIHANVLVKMDKNMIRRIMVGPNYEV